MTNENEPQFNFGDIVSVAGYYPQVFRIEGYRIEHYHYPAEEWTDFVYELVEAHTGEWLEADDEDLTILAGAAQAETYLQSFKYPTKPPSQDANDVRNWIYEGGEVMAKKEPKPTARELSAKEADKRKQERKARAEQIDNLLDQRKWYADALERTNNEEFGDRVFAIDCELKKLTERE
ncbi:MAG: hypothetical protein ACQEXB_24285 [Bacillota bacterium]